jgi:phosphatidylglycerophosphatase A
LADGAKTMKLRLAAAQLIATWFGCGLSPRAPGTVGALGALPLYWLVFSASTALYWGLVLALSGLGIWAAQVVATSRGEHDPQRVVIDEVAGVLIALGCVRGFGGGAAFAAFALFRLFDIWKPGPIARAERLPPLGLGIMADDLLAGLIAGIIARALIAVIA